jgi:hypothetical protein
MNQAPVVITYDFLFAHRPAISFSVELDHRAAGLFCDRPAALPDWTRLDYRQCACCTLNASRVTRCPVGLMLAGLVEDFDDIASFDRCTVRCTTPERTYLKDTDTQEGLFSLFGLLMATSGCPEMEFFRPMARFHLPFSTPQETLVRMLATHVLRSYFSCRGSAPECLRLEDLRTQYDRVQQVNEGVLARLQAVSRRDAGRNALTILNSLAQIMTMEIEDDLASLENLFAHH